MGGKDLTQKNLEYHPDVFADVLNATAFCGRQVIRPEELSDATPSSVYKMAGEPRGQDRDVAKFWHNGVIRIASIGIENQTKVDTEMPMRVMSYDSADYKRQALENAARRNRREPTVPYWPVTTFVLHYGTERPWRSPKSLLDMMDVHPDLHPFVNDYRINVINVAFLDDETVGRFTSDFGAIAHLLANRRKGEQTLAGMTKRLIHVEETLGLVTALTGVRFDVPIEEGKKLTTLAEYITGFELRGEARGIAQGIERGMAQGIERGMAQGIERGARGIIATGRRYGATDDQIAQDLVEQLDISAAEAERMVRETTRT